jgi:hypothetical protein
MDLAFAPFVPRHTTRLRFYVVRHVSDHSNAAISFLHIDILPPVCIEAGQASSVMSKNFSASSQVSRSLESSFCRKAKKSAKMKEVNVLSRSINKSVNLYAFEEYLSAQASLLPDLPEIKKISPRVIRVLGGNPGLVRYLPDFDLVSDLNNINNRCNSKEQIRILLVLVQNVS